MGALAGRLREQLQDLSPIIGFKIRVVERTGKNILTNFSQLQTWKGMKCGREECVTCNQGGEELPQCARRNVLYENICLLCNPMAVKKGELKEAAGEHPSI